MGAQDAEDEVWRQVQGALLKLKVLATKVPVFLEIQLADDPKILKDVDDLFRVNPRTEATILKRAGMLLPVWERANAALAALSPPQPEIALNIQGVAHTAAMLAALLTTYAGLAKAMEEKSSALDGARADLRAHDRTCDRLNKDWYRLAKAGADDDEALLRALGGIPTEPSTPAPEVVEIEHVTQGGEDGRQVLVSYVAGGGDHATTQQLEWTLPGDAKPFTHTQPLDFSGNALGPLPPGTPLTLRTSVSNSATTRTTAPRTIVIQEAIG